MDSPRRSTEFPDFRDNINQTVQVDVKYYLGYWGKVHGNSEYIYDDFQEAPKQEAATAKLLQLCLNP